MHDDKRPEKVIKSHNETEVWIEERKSLNDMLRPAGCKVAGSGN